MAKKSWVELLQLPSLDIGSRDGSPADSNTSDPERDNLDAFNRQQQEEELRRSDTAAAIRAEKERDERDEARLRRDERKEALEHQRRQNEHQYRLNEQAIRNQNILVLAENAEAAVAQAERDAVLKQTAGFVGGAAAALVLSTFIFGGTR